jgi:hypothetical protein
MYRDASEQIHSITVLFPVTGLAGLRLIFTSSYLCSGVDLTSRLCSRAHQPTLATQLQTPD